MSYRPLIFLRMNDSITAFAEYRELLDSIKQTIAAGRLRAARAVNNVLVETYWQIGREIVARQRDQGWGARVIERLSADLRTARPDMRGLSARNLRYMAALASRWPEAIGQHAAAQLPWGHVMIILDSCPDQETRAGACRYRYRCLCSDTIMENTGSTGRLLWRRGRRVRTLAP